MAYVRFADLVTPGEIPLQHIGDLGRKPRIGEDESDLEVQSERAVVEVGGTDRPHVVHQHDLLVQKSGPITKQAYAHPTSLGNVSEASQVHQPVVRLCREHDAHVHSAHRRKLKSGDHRLVGDEIGTGDPQSFLCAVDGMEKEQAAGLVLVGGSGRQDQHRHLARRVQGYAPVEDRQPLRRPIPILQKGKLNRQRSRSADLRMGIAPGAELGIETQVLVADGQTVVLGGIYETERRETINKVPFLGDIPGLGYLFRSKSRIDNKAELLIFVTPRILDEGSSIY